MEETKTNRIEVPIKDKYLLTIRGAGAYFGLGTKLLRRMAEENAGGFAIMIGNRYMIARSKLKLCFNEKSEGKNNEDILE